MLRVAICPFFDNDDDDECLSQLFNVKPTIFEFNTDI